MQIKTALYSLLVFTITFTASWGESSFYYKKDGTRSTLRPVTLFRSLTTDPDIAYYVNEKGHTVGVGNQIIIECKSVSVCQRLIKKYRLSASPLNKTMFLVTLEDANSTLPMAQKLFLESGVTLAQPNFIRKRNRR